MRDELTQNLREKYSKLIPSIDKVNLDVGDGWYGILDTLLGLIAVNIALDRLPSPFRVVQIKEKFGGLRFYYEPSTPEIVSYVRFAEAMADLTCEDCGFAGEGVAVTPIKNWLRTLCPNCQDKGGR